MATETRTGAPAVAYPGGEPMEAVGAVAPPLAPHVLCIFGATGDLAYKKIFPALQAMVARGGLEGVGGEYGEHRSHLGTSFS